MKCFPQEKVVYDFLFPYTPAVILDFLKSCGIIRKKEIMQSE